MAQVVVRNLEDRVVQNLKIKAELHGHSLEQELRDILSDAAKLSREERLSIIDRIRAMAPAQTSDSADLVRADRDSRR
ncbi:hypothetical protein [Inquilinus sp. CAU 1745]|uniref:FitA-like ribbon-helix-helix domain-containing protein n=1 Tax=Inquilinus sp. CAU 1745 TaxID=3140369 RepID=UPI00325A44FC